MPRYYYFCEDCEVAAAKIKGEELTYDEEWEVIFETFHLMSASEEDKKKAMVCPRCSGHKARQAFNHNEYTGYILGDGYLDKDGVRRDMNVSKLQTDDPYADMREPGEVDDKIASFKKAGKKDGKPKKHYDMSSRPSSIKKSNN
jgi:hypothetical protein